MEKKQVGRPKMYDSASDKLEAFRKRLESAGFMRKEVLVTKETWDLVTALAKENCVSVSDAASGLLEYGTRAFLSKKASASASFSLKPINLPVAPILPKPRGRPSINPIADFFAKRKDLSQPLSRDIEDEKDK